MRKLGTEGQQGKRAQTPTSTPSTKPPLARASSTRTEEQVLVRIESGLARRLRVHAAWHRQKIKAIVAHGIELALAETEGQSAA